MSIVFDFLTGVGGYLIAAAIAALGILGYGQAKKREGRKEAEDDFEEADRAQADAIRRRVERERSERVSEYDDRGWRDGE